MLVAINSNMAILVLLAFCIPKIHSQGIVQVTSFDSLRSGSDSSFTLDLYSMVNGPNLTFSLSGKYSPALPTSGISLTQNLDLAFNASKAQKSLQLENNGGLEIDYIRNLLFTLEANNTIQV